MESFYVFLIGLRIMTKTSFSRPIDYDHLHDLRRYEISFILRFLPVGKNNLSILNFGAGDGYNLNY